MVFWLLPGGEMWKRVCSYACYGHVPGLQLQTFYAHDTARRIQTRLQAQRSEESPAEPRRRFRERCYLLIVTEASEVPTAIANAGIIAISGPRHREAQCMSREL